MLKNLLQKKNSEIAFIHTPEYRQIPKLRIISILLSGIFIFFVGFSIYFVYQNIYSSLSQIESLSYIQSHSQSQTINFDALDNTQKSWDQKYSTTTLTNVHDPFLPPSATSSVKS